MNKLLALALVCLIGVLVVPMIKGHTVVHCLVKNPCSGAVTAYAGTYHQVGPYFTNGSPIGDVQVAPSGGSFSYYSFSSIVSVPNDVPDLIPYESCIFCSGYSLANVNTFQRASLGNLPIGPYDMYTESPGYVEVYEDCVDYSHPMIYSTRLFCPASQTVGMDTGKCTYTWNFVPTFNIGCNVAHQLVQLQGPAPGDFVPLGTYTATWRLDIMGVQGSSCSHTITIVDNQNPIVTCPAQVVRNTDVGRCDAVVNYAIPVFDNCEVLSVAYSKNSGTVFNLGTTTVSVVATDIYGRQASCSFPVIVQDQLDPIVNCPADIVVLTPANSCQQTATYSVSASDNCGTPVTTLSKASNTVFPLGTTKVIYTATDSSGRTAACDFTVTVMDNVVPTLTCPAPITVAAVNGECSAIVTYSMVATGDNCGISSLISNPASGFDFPVGITTVTSTLFDTSGNSNTCSFTVTVTDPTNRCLCGNGRIDSGEQCEINQLGTATCITQGYALGGVLDCTNCQYDVSRCAVCGDGRVDGTEACDGTNFDSQTCQTVPGGFTDGSLTCKQDCTAILTAGCTKCGDNVAQGSEECDGTDLRQKTCITELGVSTGGSLACTSGCTFNTSACIVPVVTLPTTGLVLEHQTLGIRVKATGFESDRKVTVTLQDGLGHSKSYTGISLSLPAGSLDATMQAPSPLAPSTNWRVSVKGESTLYVANSGVFTVRAA